MYTANELNQYTDVADVNYTYDDAGNMTYDGRYAYVYDAQNRLVEVHTAGSLAAVCDIEATFTTGGDAEWYGQASEYCAYSDDDAAQSGIIGDSQETWMEMTVYGPGTVRFYRKVSADNSDSLKFYVDAQLKATWSGSQGWGEYTQSVTGVGQHALKWRYVKDASVSGGDDCAWVDYVRWTPSQTVVPLAWLAAALDTDLDVYSGHDGDAGFYDTSWPYYSGSDAAESDYELGDDQTAVMEAVGYGTGTVSFYWKVSSEAYQDELYFYIDGVMKDYISGEEDWAQQQYTVSTEGAHVFRWEYVKDGSTSEGDDCAWVDYLQWAGETQPPDPPAGDTWETVTYVYDPAG
ncbi:MAG: hypothetical protein JW993_21045, partial [Sedimentisphaerales bacterium]|nr:hypothetical protein [Sedimentisphaerales bacterium]